jgi:hypothetical protein
VCILLEGKVQEELEEELEDTNFSSKSILITSDPLNALFNKKVPSDSFSETTRVGTKAVPDVFGTGTLDPNRRTPFT